MREFIVIGHTATCSANFPLDDLPGGAGRLDVLCRCVCSGFFTSHEARKEVRLMFCLQDQYVIRFEGDEIKRVNPDERSTGALFQKALKRRHLAEREGTVESTPGVYIEARSFEDVLKQAGTRGTMIQLHEDGKPVSEMTPFDHPVFVLSDHKPFSSEEQDLLDEHAENVISIGPRSLHAHQAMTIMHHYLDTGGYQSFCSGSPESSTEGNG